MAATLELQHRECERNPRYFIQEMLLTEDPQDTNSPYKPTSLAATIEAS